MSSYTKWDRAAYIERVGGQEEAERRRKTGDHTLTITTTEAA